MKPVVTNLNSQPLPPSSVKTGVYIGAGKKYPPLPSAYPFYAPYFSPQDEQIALNPLKPGEYYRKNLHEKFWDSYVRGTKKFYKSLKEKPIKGTFVVASSVALGTLLSAFNRRIDMTLKLGLITATMIFPIMHANNNFPKIEKAYDEYKAGNPAKADRMFNEALDDSVYTIFHAFLRPITLAVAWGAIFSIPNVVRLPRKEVRGMIETIAHLILNFKPLKAARTVLDEQITKLGLPESVRPTYLMRKYNGKLSSWGQNFEKNLDANFPRLSKYIPDI